MKEVDLRPFGTAKIGRKIQKTKFRLDFQLKKRKKGVSRHNVGYPTIYFASLAEGPIMVPDQIRSSPSDPRQAAK